MRASVPAGTWVIARTETRSARRSILLWITGTGDRSIKFRIALTFEPLILFFYQVDRRQTDNRYGAFYNDIGKKDGPDHIMGQ